MARFDWSAVGDNFGHKFGVKMTEFEDDFLGLFDGIDDDFTYDGGAGGAGVGGGVCMGN